MSGAAVVQRVEMQFTPGVWTHNTDVPSSQGLTWRRGINGRGPKDVVFDAGTLTFALNNAANNSGHLQGYYSPDHVNCRAGFADGIPVRVVYAYASVDYVQWTGTLQLPAPMPGQYGKQYVHCTAVSTVAPLLEAKIKAIAPQLDQTEVELLTAVYAAIPATAQPPATDFDPPVDVYPFAFHDLESGTIAMTVLHDVVLSTAGGVLIELGDGTHRYINRATRASTLSAFAFTDVHLDELVRPTTPDGTFNALRTWTHAPAVGDVTTDVLASHQGKLALPAGESLELFLDYRDPLSNDYMGGTDFQDPLVSGVDYLFNAADDGSGADVTAAVTVAETFFASSLKVTLTNTGGVTAYKQILQGRGRSIRDLSPVPSDAALPMPYGVRSGEDVDLRYQDDPMIGRDQGIYWVAKYASLADQVEAIGFLANRSAAAMLQALTREVGDVVTVSEVMTGTVAVAGYIQWKEFTVTPGPRVMCRFGLAPRVENQIDVADGVRVADVLVMSSVAPETRIGIARIGQSSIAA